MYGNMHALMNNATPNPNLTLSSSSAPDMISSIPKNPNITGRICEKIVVPTAAILNHYNNF